MTRAFIAGEWREDALPEPPAIVPRIVCACGTTSPLTGPRESGFTRLDCTGCTRTWIVACDE